MNFLDSLKQLDEKIPVGLSMCLLGENVRYNGGHKKDRYVHECLSPYFEWVPVCPEVEVGMGVPRETVQLVGAVEQPKMLGSTSRKDWTEAMNTYAKTKTEQLQSQKICGFIFKKDSPSCGVERVKIHTELGVPYHTGRGLFAEVFIKNTPLVPVEEEGRLNNFKLRENFIECVFSYARLQKLLALPFAPKHFVEFHSVHKYLLLAHSPKHYQRLGQLVGRFTSETSPEVFSKEYSLLFMEALHIKTTPKKHVNVLHHILGFLKKQLTAYEKQSILMVIEDYQKEFIPLIVPLTLLKHYVEKYEVQYILNQFYLNPHPKELLLRNHV